MLIQARREKTLRRNHTRVGRVFPGLAHIRGEGRAGLDLDLDLGWWSADAADG